MNARSGCLLIALVALVLAGSARAADAPPTATQILDRYIQAAGGRPALEKLKSRVMKGSVEVTALGASGQFEVRSKAPNRQVSKIEFGGFGTMREGYDGTNGWTAVPGLGGKAKTGADLARAGRSTAFPRELKLAETYARFEVKGAAKVGPLDTWLLEAFPKDGKPDRLYFDQKSGLLVREESTIGAITGEMLFQIDLGDYREVDGVQVPFSLKIPQPAEMGFQVKLTEVKHNGELADADFAPPKD